MTAAVYGPREVARRSEFSTSGQLSCELKFAPFSGRRRRGYLPDDQERELSQTLRTAVEPAVCLVSDARRQRRRRGVGSDTHTRGGRNAVELHTS